jgi:uncharacterized protein (DUF4415 family)
MSLILLRTSMDALMGNTSHNLRPQSRVQTMMSTEQEKKDDRLVNLRIKSSTMERFRLQGYYKSTVDEILRGLLDRIETCRCRPVRRVSV